MTDRKNKGVDCQLAIVTGASGGIGLCFCRELARLGVNLVMVSNEKDLLEERAEEISDQFKVKTYPYYLDLTDPHAHEILAEWLDRKDLEPDTLINNAGIFSFDTIASTPERKIDRFLDLHCRAVTKLSRKFAARFVARGGGRILNMSSMSCWMPMPGIALYSATKAYIRVLSRAMHYELKDTGVSVTVACPGGIATDLFGLPERLKNLALSLGAIDSPERFARKAVKRMLKGKKQYINGPLNRLVILLAGMTPTHGRMLIKHKMLDKGITR